MSRLSRLPSLWPVGCQHTAASLIKTPLFDVKIVKTSVLKPCRLPTYSCKFDKNTPVWCQDRQDMSRLPSLSPVGCQHTAATKTPLFNVKIVKTSVLMTCRLPTYSCKFDKNTPVWCQDRQDMSRLPSLSPVGCQHTAASLTKTPLFNIKIVQTSVLKPCRLPTYSCKFDKNTLV